MHDQGIELVLQPGLGRRALGLDLDLPVGLDRDLAGELAAVEPAGDVGGEPGEVLPGGAMSDSVRKEGVGRVIGRAALKRPGEGQAGEFADLVVALAVQGAGPRDRLADRDRVSSGCRRRPDAVPSAAAVMVCSVMSGSSAMKTAAGTGRPSRRATRRTTPEGPAFAARVWPDADPDGFGPLSNVAWISNGTSRRGRMRLTSSATPTTALG